jgi:transposase
MSRHPQPLEPVPEDTARVARAAFPQGIPYVTLRDQLEIIFQDEDFAALFPVCGQRAYRRNGRLREVAITHLGEAADRG